MPGTQVDERFARPATGLLVGDWERAIAPAATTSFDQMYRPSAASIAELRRQQAEFGKTKRQLDRENAWLAIPALAPVVAVAGAEVAAAAAARLAPEVVKRGPLVLTERMPYLRVGDNWATRAGRRAHAELKRKIAQKSGWESEPAVLHQNGRIVRPDVRTPPRVRPNDARPKPYQMELKPNTPSGRRAAARAMKKYEGTDTKTRPIYYDPKPYI